MKKPVHIALWIEGGVLQSAVASTPVVLHVLHVFDVDNLNEEGIEEDMAGREWLALRRIHKMVPGNVEEHWQTVVGA